MTTAGQGAGVAGTNANAFNVVRPSLLGNWTSWTLTAASVNVDALKATIIAGQRKAPAQARSVAAQRLEGCGRASALNDRYP
jgi:hypothetical protein